MAKTKTIWSCIECGHRQPKWMGQCPSCQKWNVFHQEVELKVESKRSFLQEKQSSKPVRITEVPVTSHDRFHINMPELERLLGGGLVAGSLSLLGGEPGIGKSTLTLQIADALAKHGYSVLYVSGEESLEQISIRAKRLNVESEQLYFLAETNFSLIKNIIESSKPHFVMIDSIQIMYKDELPSLPGSVTQVKEIGTELVHLAKGLNTAIWVIGHVTKSGEIAGPRLLEHLVDTVLYFEGDRQHHYRILRSVKNRFGPTDEIAVFKMQQQGLQEVGNPSAIFLEDRQEGVTGNTVIPVLEGSRPILIEVQALVTDTVFSSPMRKTGGLDPNRLALLLAVLEKRAGYPLHRSDVFVSIAGGFKVVEPAADLGILVAIVSSLLNRRLTGSEIILGEVGLAGDVRRVPRIEMRLKEAARMGFKKAIIPKKNASNLSQVSSKLDIVEINFVDEAIAALLS